jgi:hypothetical protein
MKRLFVLLAIPTIITMLVVGCAGKYTGGGHIESATDPDAKANFGFNMHAIDEDGDEWADTYKGQLQYNDHGAGVQFHGEVTYVGILDEESYGYFEGTYTPQPKNQGPGGIFNAWVYDGGEPGVSEGDVFEIFLWGGVHHRYYNWGPIDGGNIQYHPPEEEE